MKSFNEIVMAAGQRYTNDPNLSSNSKLVTFSQENITATSWGLLVDKSDIVRYPHKSAVAPLKISYVALQVDRAINSLGRVSISLIYRIDGTSADIITLRRLTFNRNTEQFIERAENFAPAAIDCAVVDGAAVNVLSADTQTNVTGVNTATDLSGPAGLSRPGLGDIVVNFMHTSGGAWFGAASVIYTTDASTNGN